MTSNYIGGGVYEVWIRDQYMIFNEDVINEITAHNFKDNSVGKSNKELEETIEDLEYKTSEEIDFAVRTLNDISEKIMKVQRQLDDLTDEVENTDKELFKILSDIGDELDKVNEFTLDMESSIIGS